MECAVGAAYLLVNRRQVDQNRAFLASSEESQEMDSWSENLLFPTDHADAHTQNEAAETAAQGTSQMTDALSTCGI